MKPPSARGPASTALLAALARTPHDLDPIRFAAAAEGSTAALDDEDLQLSLFVMYELAYRGWDGVDDAWEWEPSLIRLRTTAETRFEAALRALTAPYRDEVPADPSATAIARTLAAMAEDDDGPSLSGYLRGRATIEQFREFAAHRSVYQLREADPHTFAIPRLAGAAKAALIEIQIDEYGHGRAAHMHQELYKGTMTALGLDTTYGAYIDVVPALTLATNNLMSLFALHRRRRGALLGHLAAYEMTSTGPNRAYGNGLRRLGGDASATRFYDEHVEADAVHEQVAAHDMCGVFCAGEPERAADVLFGARCVLALDARWAASVLAAWERGESSLLGFA